MEFVKLSRFQAATSGQGRSSTDKPLETKREAAFKNRFVTENRKSKKKKE
jgi:hypothetical protein